MLIGPAKQELMDEVLHEEITALADVILATADASGPLSQDEVTTSWAWPLSEMRTTRRDLVKD